MNIPNSGVSILNISEFILIIQNNYSKKESKITFKPFENTNHLRFHTQTHIVQSEGDLYMNGIKVKNVYNNVTQNIDSFLIKPFVNQVIYEDFNFDGFYDHSSDIELF